MTSVPYAFMPGAATTLVGRTRLHASGKPDALTQRWRAERALQQVDAERIAARQILIVREVHGTLARGSGADMAFGRRATDVLAALRDHAARPGPGARSAHAVLFDSFDELLLELALDMTNARLDDCWYWRELHTLVPRTALAGLTPLLVTFARELPAVARLAVDRGELRTLATSCAARDGESILRALVRALDVADAVAEAGQRFPGTLPLFRAPQSVVQAEHGPQSQHASDARAYAADNVASAPVSPLEHPAMADVIGIHAARALDGLPVSVRAAFAVALAFDAAPGSQRRVRHALAASIAASPSHTRTIDTASTSVDAPYPPAIAPRNRESTVGPHATWPAIGTSSALASGGELARDHLQRPVPVQRGRRAQAISSAPSATHRVSSESPTSRAAEGVTSSLAGAFFLLPLVGTDGASIAATSWQGGWTVFRDLAWHLCQLAYRGDRDWRDDPLWPALAALAGDEHADDLRIRAAARRCLRRLGARWPDTERLRVALHRVVSRRGIVTTSRTHIDVVFALDEVSVPVRRAGLDLDPGWVSWLGRVITFHYE